MMQRIIDPDWIGPMGLMMLSVDRSNQMLQQLVSIWSLEGKGMCISQTKRNVVCAVMPNMGVGF